MLPQLPLPTFLYPLPAQMSNATPRVSPLCVLSASPLLFTSRLSHATRNALPCSCRPDLSLPTLFAPSAQPLSAIAYSGPPSTHSHQVFYPQPPCLLDTRSIVAPLFLSFNSFVVIWYCSIESMKLISKARVPKIR
ncbi:hypothetical protein BD779DRAFT_209111 [Infundibulicybe gibba]|nr:hypothetical protein BD779DRAFT_209111 [Infundibulicybe gibba]